MAHAFDLGGELHDVWLARTPRGHELHIGEERVAVALRDQGEHVQELRVGDDAQPVWIAVRGDDIHIHVSGETHTLRYAHSLERFAQQAQDRSEAVSRAPMPGAVIALQVAPGQDVGRGDTLLVIESMKMETAICAGIDGRVQQVLVQPGQTFERDAVLVVLEALEADA